MNRVRGAVVAATIVVGIMTAAAGAQLSAWAASRPSLGLTSRQTHSLQGGPDVLSAVHNVCGRFT